MEGKVKPAKESNWGEFKLVPFSIIPEGKALEFLDMLPRAHARGEERVTEEINWPTPKSLRDPSRISFAVLRGQEPIGVISGEIIARTNPVFSAKIIAPPKKWLKVDFLYTFNSPGFARAAKKTVGSALVEHLMGFARKRGIKEIEVCWPSKNTKRLIGRYRENKEFETFKKRQARKRKSTFLRLMR